LPRGHRLGSGTIGSSRRATKADIKLLDGKLSAMEGKLTLLVWVVGSNVAATITMLVRHW